MALSNYSPSTSLFLNPSSIADTRVFLDLHFAGVGASVHNDFVHMPETFRLSSLWKESETVPDPEYRRNSGPYNAYVAAIAQGPTISACLGDKSFAFGINVRSFTDARNIPNHLANYMVEGFKWPDQMGQTFYAKDIRVNSLSFAEFALSYGAIVKAGKGKLLTAGFTLRQLMGIAAAGIKLNRWTYMVPDTLDIETYSIHGNYGVHEPAFNSGTGWGGDIGITLKRGVNVSSGHRPLHPESGCNITDYTEKIGFSLLDVGRLRVDPEFYDGSFDGEFRMVWENYSASDPDNLEGLTDIINTEFFAKSTESREGKRSLRMSLPTALSLQYDRHIGSGIFLGGVWIQGIEPKNLGPRRMNQLSFIPRFERRRFEVSMPLILREYREPSLGLAFRLNSVIIGSDRVGSLLFGRRDRFGADLYIQVKYSIFRRTACTKQGRSVKPDYSVPLRKQGSSKPCPAWRS